MVGEIRERETAEIAVQAALTGHLVLSTLHTNDSVGAITRMIDMGIEPYLLSSALIGVVAQRLVRTICPSCKTSFLAPPKLLNDIIGTKMPIYVYRKDAVVLSVMTLVIKGVLVFMKFYRLTMIYKDLSFQILTAMS